MDCFNISFDGRSSSGDVADEWIGLIKLTLNISVGSVDRPGSSRFVGLFELFDGGVDIDRDGSATVPSKFASSIATFSSITNVSSSLEDMSKSSSRIDLVCTSLFFAGVGFVIVIVADAIADVTVDVATVARRDDVCLLVATFCCSCFLRFCI